MFISMLFIWAIISGKVYLYKLKSLIDKLLFSYQIFCLTFLSKFANIIFIKFCF